MSFHAHNEEPNMKLDDFAKSYKSLLQAGIHGTLLAKCMNDYQYGQIGLSDPCFKIGSSPNHEIQDKDGNPVTMTYNGNTITWADLSSSYGVGTTPPFDISFGKIVAEVSSASYNADPNAFMDDWKDFRTSLGDIGKNPDGSFSLTSNKLIHFDNEFEQSIRDKYKENAKKRNNLDNKMRELYGEKGDPDLNLDASVYSTMLFTIMTTSLLYYLFIKI